MEDKKITEYLKEGDHEKLKGERNAVKRPKILKGMPIE
jgi:hypothetical protein